jgi:hypothetical protein
MPRGSSAKRRDNRFSDGHAPPPLLASAAARERCRSINPSCGQDRPKNEKHFVGNDILTYQQQMNKYNWALISLIVYHQGFEGTPNAKC